MSLGEHFCNNCFDNYYRTGKNGNLQYSSWCHEWGNIARVSKATLKGFVANELLPYWIQCNTTDCNKWRLVSQSGVLDPQEIRFFSCSSKLSNVSDCSVAEDSQVSRVMEEYWMSQVIENPLLKNSPAAPYLRRFLPEDIGLCPLSTDISPLDKVENIDPFYVGQCGESLIWVKPDAADEVEQSFYKTLGISQPTYLGLRNLIVTLWNLAPTVWLTIEKVSPYIICRGLVRIYLHFAAQKILDFLTMRAVINYGIIKCPPANTIFADSKADIIVIGAGISGLAAAKHLSNLGLNVVVLEARSCLGGRAFDDVTGSSPLFVEGLINNPFSIMALQSNQKYCALDKSFVLFGTDGKEIPSKDVAKVNYELNGLVFGAIEWASMCNKDANWFDTIVKSYNDMKKVAPHYTEFDVFNFCLNQYEIDLKCDMKNLSLQSWEFTTSLMGDTGVFHDGLMPILNKLSENLKIFYNTRVVAVDFSNDVSEIICTKEKFHANKILITVPVSSLRCNDVKFKPPLPHFKMKALNDIGDYYCEQLVLKFAEKFWIKKLKKQSLRFGIISADQKFYLFTDVTQKKKNSIPTLITFIPIQHLNESDNRDNIIQQCLTLLRDIFSKVPDPIQCCLTNWKEKSCGASYGSFIKVGSSQTVFDELTKPVDSKLFFAGEGTFKNCRSTLTGAYLSGLQGAANIAFGL
ncbi:lysine-specific histone demethylase 1B-like [Uloborus diversus]|uniref:lysine-specific histone demethylase 1B-like n=1 Tax=Uloborus diversus TaxID=327109 RepID=UPI00240977FB|nr:lysine-specific histone demethylase 1B-like [Uloborus diversus]